MIVEPTPTTPRSPRRRLLGLVAILAPLVLLVIAVGAGVLGTERPPSSALAVIAASPADPSTTTAGPGPAGTPAAGSPSQSPSLPTHLGDLRILPVARIAEAARGVTAATAVALSGFVWITGTDPACGRDETDPLGPRCDREAILVDQRFANASAFLAEPAPHVRLVIPVGVRIPAGVVAAMTQPGAEGPHVVVVGRFTAAPDACGDAEGCDWRLVIDRFAWVDGIGIGATPLIDGRLAAVGTMIATAPARIAG
jgi:hypothetical protein